MIKKTLRRGLYGMLDLPPAPFPTPSPRSIYEPLFAAGVPVLQLRMKGATAAAMLEVLGELHAHRPAETLLIVNDRLDVALAGGADGVHLGQDDLPLEAARRVCAQCGRPDFLIGISTHNEAQAAAALEGGADYIALGPIYPTTSKANPDPVVGPERLAALCRTVTRPLVAIGGISLDRVGAIVAAGAHCAAIIGAVNHAADVGLAASKVQEQFLTASS
jgi:thiamine-phosphate pyrophosphorylase